MGLKIGRDDVGSLEGIYRRINGRREMPCSIFGWNSLCHFIIRWRNIQEDFEVLSNEICQLRIFTRHRYTENINQIS